MPTCYMLIGLPGSGKSTVSEELIKQIPQLKIVSTDNLIEAYAKEKSKKYEEVHQEYVDTATKMMNAQIREFVSQKINFIWDQTNVYASARKKKINLLHQNKYDVVAIAIELSDKELEKRLAHRVANDGKKISMKTIMNLKSEYVLPTYEEGFVEIYMIKDDGKHLLLEKSSHNQKSTMR